MPKTVRIVVELHNCTTRIPTTDIIHWATKALHETTKSYMRPYWEGVVAKGEGILIDTRNQDLPEEPPSVTVEPPKVEEPVVEPPAPTPLEEPAPAQTTHHTTKVPSVAVVFPTKLQVKGAMLERHLNFTHVAALARAFLDEHGLTDISMEGRHASILANGKPNGLKLEQSWALYSVLGLTAPISPRLNGTGLPNAEARPHNGEQRGHGRENGTQPRQQG